MYHSQNHSDFNRNDKFNIKIRKAWVTFAPLASSNPLFLHLALPLQLLVPTYPTLALEPTTLCWWEGGPDIWWQPSLWERQARHGIVRLRKAGYGRNRLLPWGESSNLLGQLQTPFWFRLTFGWFSTLPSSYASEEKGYVLQKQCGEPILMWCCSKC